MNNLVLNFLLSAEKLSSKRAIIAVLTADHIEQNREFFCSSTHIPNYLVF